MLVTASRNRSDLASRDHAGPRSNVVVTVPVVRTGPALPRAIRAVLLNFAIAVLLSVASRLCWHGRSGRGARDQKAGGGLGPDALPLSYQPPRRSAACGGR